MHREAKDYQYWKRRADRLAEIFKKEGNQPLYAIQIMDRNRNVDGSDVDVPWMGYQDIKELVRRGILEVAHQRPYGRNMQSFYRMRAQPTPLEKLVNEKKCSCPCHFGYFSGHLQTYCPLCPGTCSCNPAYDKDGFCSECGKPWGFQIGQEPRHKRKKEMDRFDMTVKYMRNGEENEKASEILMFLELPGENGNLMRSHPESKENAEEIARIWKGRGLRTATFIKTTTVEYLEYE